MEHERLTYLLKKYKNGSCTREELEELDAIYAALDKKEYNELPDGILQNVDQYTAERFRRLKQIVDRPNLRKTGSAKAIWYKVAAAVLVIAVAGALLYQQFGRSFSHGSDPAVVSYSVGAGTEINSRFLQLPDSSVVILRAGSKLQMDTNRFNASGRNVTLNGEAYFDIHHDDKKPFIIKVGDVNVTVLGTAFNIRESGDSVSVSVTRGKVRVSTKGKIVAVLTAAQQVVYVKQHAAQQTIQSEEAIRWMKQELQFSGESFATIATMLEERYNVHIIFDSENIKACKVSAVDAFNGTENIDEVLNFICTIISATYTKQGTTIRIHGEGCEE